MRETHESLAITIASWDFGTKKPTGTIAWDLAESPSGDSLDIAIYSKKNPVCGYRV